MIRPLSALIQVWKLDGFPAVARALRVRLGHRADFVRFAIDLTEWDPPPPDPRVEIRAGLAELRRFRRNSRARLSAEFYADRIQGARRPYLGLVDGTVGHISWMLRHGDRARLVRLAPREVELDFAYTFPGARGRGLLSAVERAILTDAKRDGAATAYTHVGVDNIASIRGVLKTGFVAVGTVTLTWTLGVPTTHFTPDSAAPAEHEKVGAR